MSERVLRATVLAVFFCGAVASTSSVALAQAADGAAADSTGASGPLGDPIEAGRQSMAAGDAAQAVARFTIAVQIDPNDPVALNNLATARAAQGDYGTAYDLLRRAVTIAPGRTDIAANLAALQKWLQSRSDIALISGTAAAEPQDASIAAADVPSLWDSSADASAMLAPSPGSIQTIPVLPAPAAVSASLSPGEAVLDSATAVPRGR